MTARDIRVRIAEAIPKVVVRGFDLRFSAGETVAATDRSSEWELRCNGTKVSAIQIGGDQARKPRLFAGTVRITSPAGMLHFRNRPYRAALRVTGVGAHCEVVNEVDLEDYLQGVVNAEFNSKWRREAIEAQVIAARTYALHQIGRARLDPAKRWDVEATTKDQVYDGSEREDFLASRAVSRTRGMILTAGPGAAPLKAFYHSTCGGMTELPEEVWGSAHPGFRRKVTCSWCGSSPRDRWNVDLSARELSESLLRGAHAKPPAGWPREWSAALRAERLIDIRTDVRTAPGGAERVNEVVTVWAMKGKASAGAVELRVPAARFRDWVGPTRLRSTSFQIVSHRARWRFEGRGNGHGVGMCQWGAKVMAEKGHDTVAILKHYYPDAAIRKLW